MNHTLPPTREVPPRRHAQIRARLEREVTHRRVRFAPLITAGVAAAAVVVLVAVVAPPWQAGDDFAVGGTSQTVVTTTTEEPVVPKLPPERIAEIEQGCAQGAGVTSKPVLRQYVTDEHGEFALLYSERDSLACTINGPIAPYSSAVASGPEFGWLPGEFAADHVSSSFRGEPGRADGPEYDMAVGRVTSKVARVTFGRNGQEVDATIVDGTFVARITLPSDWPGFVDWDERNFLRAYDAHGALLGEWQAGWDRTRCWVDPSGKIVAGYHDRDPATCAPAVAWE